MTEFEAFAIDLARAAAAVTLPRFRSDYGQENKAAEGFDPVTDADREAEAVQRKLIAERYPHHGVIGEEYGADRPDAEHVWVLDPIDGTRAFISGLPLWTTLIGLTDQGRPVVGAISQPYIGELFLGGPSGARLLARGQDRSIRTRACGTLSEATLSTTEPALFQNDEADAWSRLRDACRLTRLGCDAYAYAMVAAGQMDVVCENGLKPWDWTALVPVIEAAGGRVTHWSGAALDGSGHVLAVGDPRLTDEASGLLRSN